MMPSSGMPPSARPRSTTGLHSRLGVNPSRHLQWYDPGRFSHSVDLKSHWKASHSFLSSQVGLMPRLSRV